MRRAGRAPGLDEHAGVPLAELGSHAETAQRSAERGFHRTQVAVHVAHSARIEVDDGVAHELPRGCAAAYFPEANPLVPAADAAEGSNTPAYKSIEISLTRA